VDIKRGKAAAAARELGLRRVHAGTGLARVMDAVRPDFVLNVSFPESHSEVTIAALEAGLPVLCEKPMATSMEAARQMVAASERTGKLLMISQQRRYDQRLAAMRKMIVNHLGPLGILNSDFYLGYPAGGFRDAMASPLLLDMAIHTFDAARYVSGADPVTVYCEEFDPPWSWYAGPASATAIFEMTAGLRYTYRGSWCSQGMDTSWEAEWRAVGRNGTVIWDGVGSPRGEIVGEPGVFPASTRRLGSGPAADGPADLIGPLHDFLDALDTGSTPMGECHDNIKSLAMVFGAIESAARGCKVAI
jgi:predicted dehydrogenase